MSDPTLTHGFMAEVARKAATSYKSALGAIALLEGAAGVAMLIAPRAVGRLMGASYAFGDAGEAVWVRLAGALLLLAVVLLLTGRIFPVHSKITNLLGIIGRGLIGLLLILSGGRPLFVGLFELAASGLLALLYYKLFRAEVMNRP